ncbi:MAG: DUF2490 domain-containing protein [Vicinamibacterales bacterium]
MSRASKLGVWVAGAILLAGGAAKASAQTISDHRAWLVVTAQPRPRPGSPWFTTVEGIVRSRDGLGTLDVLAVRPSLFRRISPRTTVGGGYLYARQFAPAGDVVEHRVYGQFAATAPAPGGTWAFRSRVEARFIDGNDGSVTRLRQQVRFTHPWRAGSRVALTGYEEIFVHADAGARTRRGVDQNRVFAGVSVPVGTTRLEVGYLHHFIPGHGGRSRVNHVLSVALGIPF